MIGQITWYSWVNFTWHMFDLAWSIHRKCRPNIMRHTLTPLSNHCKFQGVPHATVRISVETELVPFWNAYQFGHEENRPACIVHTLHPSFRPRPHQGLGSWGTGRAQWTALLLTLWIATMKIKCKSALNDFTIKGSYKQNKSNSGRWIQYNEP